MTASSVIPRREFLTWGKVKLLWALLAGVVVVGGLGYAKERWAFGLNMTESLPHWAFIVDDQLMPVRGEMAMFEVPNNPYYRDRPFVKRVAGVAGDRVENRSGRIFISGEFVGEAKPEARDGRPLVAIEGIVIPEGYVFMLGTHRDSYDSRYAEIGLIPVERIVGRAHSVL